MKKEKVGLITFEESEVDQIEGIGEGDAEKVFPQTTSKLMIVLQGLIRVRQGVVCSCYAFR